MGARNLNRQVLYLFQIIKRKNRSEQLLQVLQKEIEEEPQFHGENNEEEATPEEACNGSKLCPWASFPLCTICLVANNYDTRGGGKLLKV